MTDTVLHLLLIAVGGIIIADLIVNPKGTTAMFGGLGKLFQIFTQPTNTKGL